MARSKNSTSVVAQVAVEQVAAAPVETPTFVPMSGVSVGGYSTAPEAPAAGGWSPVTVDAGGVEAGFTAQGGPRTQAAAPAGKRLPEAGARPMLEGHGTQTQYTLLGQSACAVIRWLGAQGCTPSQIKRALAAHGVVVAGATVKTQYQHGRHGRHGLPNLGSEGDTLLAQARG